MILEYQGNITPTDIILSVICVPTAKSIIFGALTIKQTTKSGIQFFTIIHSKYSKDD